MRSILARAHREALREFLWSNVLLAFDYDGTLAPIVEDPDRAQMRRETRDLLTTLAKRCPVIVISGRAQADARDKLVGVGVAEVVGNHGMEPWHAARKHVAEVRRWLPRVDALAWRFRGVLVEDKTYSLAVHYRQSREKKKARAAILELVSELGDVRIIGGKQVVNILPANAAHKGIALERERKRLRCDTAIYVGDDETDEDVFNLDQPGRLLTIRVGAKRTSAAAYCIRSQQSIDDLLRLLIGLHDEREQRRRMLR